MTVLFCTLFPKCWLFMYTSTSNIVTIGVVAEERRAAWPDSVTTSIELCVFCPHIRRDAAVRRCDAAATCCGAVRRMRRRRTSVTPLICLCVLSQCCGHVAAAAPHSVTPALGHGHTGRDTRRDSRHAIRLATTRLLKHVISNVGGHTG